MRSQLAPDATPCAYDAAKRLLTFRPRPPWLDPLDTKTVERWLAESAGLPRLGSAARASLAHVVYDVLANEAHPESYADDPADTGVELDWDPAWRPAPSYDLVPVLLPDLGWTFDWCVPDPDAELVATHDDEDDPWSYVTSTLEIDDERAFLETQEGSLSIRDGEVDVDWFEDCDGQDPDILIRVVQGLTGWVAVQPTEPRVEFEPVRCLKCGEETQIQRCYGGACPSCSSRRLVWSPEETPEPEIGVELATAAKTLVAALVQARVLCLHAETDRVLLAFTEALASPESGRELAHTLTVLDEVDELFLDDHELADVVLAW